MGRSCVLLLDDNSMQHKLFECYARSMPEVDLEYAFNVEQAFEVIDTKKPDLLILDNRLRPFTSCEETVPLLREHGFFGKIVVISSDVSGFSSHPPKDGSVAAYIDKGDFTFRNFKEKMDVFLVN